MELPKEVVFEMGLQELIRGILDTERTTKIKCLEEVEQALGKLQTAQDVQVAKSKLGNLLTKRARSANYSRTRIMTDLDEGKKITPYRSFCLTRLLTECTLMTHFREQVKEIFVKEELSEADLEAVRRVQAAVLERKNQLQYGEELDQVARVIKANADNGSKRCVVSKSQARKMLIENHSRSMALECLPREQCQEVFANGLNCKKREIKQILESISRRIQQYAKGRLHDFNNGVNTEALVQIEGFHGFRFATRAQRDNLQRVPKKGRKLRRDLFRCYMNIFNALPDMDRLIIPLWEKDRRRPVGRCRQAFQDEGVVTLEPNRLVKMFTDGARATSNPVLRYEYLGGRSPGPDRDRYMRERQRIFQFCGSLLADLHFEDLHEELAVYCQQEKIGLKEAVERFFPNGDESK